MNRAPDPAWSVVLGLSTMIVVTSAIGLMRSHGLDGSHFGALLCAAAIFALALSRVRRLAKENVAGARQPSKEGS